MFIFIFKAIIFSEKYKKYKMARRKGNISKRRRGSGSGSGNGIAIRNDPDAISVGEDEILDDDGDEVLDDVECARGLQAA